MVATSGVLHSAPQTAAVAEMVRDASSGARQDQPPRLLDRVRWAIRTRHYAGAPSGLQHFPIPRTGSKRYLDMLGWLL